MKEPTQGLTAPIKWHQDNIAKRTPLVFQGRSCGIVNNMYRMANPGTQFLELKCMIINDTISLIKTGNPLTVCNQLSLAIWHTYVNDVRDFNRGKV